MSAAPSKFWGAAITLGLTAMGLIFLFAVMDDARGASNPTPVFATVAAAAIYVVLLRGPVGRAIGKMLEGQGPADDQLLDRIEQLEDRQAEHASERLRIAELEERLDFAERLLSQREQLPAFRPPEGM